MWKSVARFQFQRETGNCHLFEVSACKVVNGLHMHTYLPKVNRDRETINRHIY